MSALSTPTVRPEHRLGSRLRDPVGVDESTHQGHTYSRSLDFWMAEPRGNCGARSVTWIPMRQGDLHFVEDVEAAWRLWADRRREIGQYLRVRYGRSVDVSLLALVLQDCEFLTSASDSEFVAEMHRNGVTVEGVGE